VDRPGQKVPSIRTPACPQCGKGMRLQSAEPDARYRNIQHVSFVCDCGHSSDRTVADAE